MNFSEYTLISFGDSFTFGQDIVPIYKHQPHGSPKQWKKDCNLNSFTQVIADRMGFKDCLNFGVLAGSNERSFTLVESFLRTNPDKKVFVLFNFTSSSRFMLFPQLNENHNYFTSTESLGHYDCIDIRPFSDDDNDISDGRYSGTNTKSINQQYTYWRNSIQDVYNHIKDRRTVYYMLSSYNVPYATFDVMNDTDYRMLRNNPINYIHRDDVTMHNDDERYVFKERDFLKSYHKELVDKSPLLTHMGIDYLSGKRNIFCYINDMGRDKHNDTNYYKGEDSGHWNSEGHREVAKLIEKFINEKYDN
jgi:hypothetical protein